MPQAIAQVVSYAIGVATGGSAVAGSAAAIIGNVVAYSAITAASMAASKLLSPKAPSFKDTAMTDRAQMVRSPIAARQIIYGQSKVSGVLVYISTTGTKNEFLHLVIALAGHEVEEIGDIYFNDELVLTGALDGAATGKYSGYGYIKKHLGLDPETADADLISATASLTDGKWTSDHRLDGVAYLYVKLTWNAEVFLNGIPNISAVVKGKKVYDPRTATTAWSCNPALCIRDFVTDTTYGVPFATSEIDDASVIVAANICEEQVLKLPVSPATYENRYDANGVLFSSASPQENLGRLLSSMGGLVAYSGGKLVLYAAAWRTPTVTLTEKHLVGQISVQAGTSARDRVNGVKGTYVSAVNDYQVTDFPAIVSAANLSEDNGVRHWRDVTLPFTTSPSCTQRLAVIELRRAREDVTVTAKFRLEAMQVRAGDTVRLTIARLGWSAKIFEVMEWHLALDGTPPLPVIEMTLRETASTIYDWDVDEQIEVDQAPNTTLPNPFNVAAPSSLVLTADGTTQLIQGDGTVISRIKLTWVPPSQEFTQSGGYTVTEYKDSADATYTEWSRIEGNRALEYISGDIKIGRTYNIRVFSINYLGATSDYVTGSVTVSADTVAPAAPTGLLVSAGTGQALSLDWDDNVEPDLGDYGVWRNTTNNAGTATQVARVRASRFVDVSVTIGTTYYYWVSAYDRLGNQSAKSNSSWTAPTTVGSTDIADFAVTTQKLADNAISQIKLQDAIVSNAKLVDAAVTAVKIATAAITEVKIDTSAVTADKIAVSAVTTAKLAANAVEADKIAANAVTADKIVANAVTADKIAANAVTADKINANAVTADKIAANSITASKVGANEIIANSANIADGVILSAKIASLAANKISAGTLNAMTLTAAKTATDTEFFNPGATNSTFPSVAFQRHESSTGWSSLGLGGTEIWLTTFYGWSTGTGFVNDRYGKANTNFITMCNAGGSVAGGSYLDLEIIYSLNGGAAVQITPFASRALDDNGSLNLTGGVNLTGLSATGYVTFGVRAKSDNAATALNVVSLVTLSINV